MNNIYRVIWNASSNVWQAVSEIGRSGGKTQSVRDGSGASGSGAMRSFAATALMMACAMAHAGVVVPPLPVISTGANAISATQVGTPDAAIGTAGNKMTITQSTSKAVLNWVSFDVASGNTVEFQQPNASAIALNRVIGTGGTIARSLIDGTITANGNIFLINPAGITFGKGAEVNVGGIVASTRNLVQTDEQFLTSQGQYSFVGLSEADKDKVASIINYGKITATQEGYVVFIAAKIVNTVHADDTDKVGGKITAKNVALAAGDDVMLEIAQGVPLITVNEGTKNALIENGGWIKAADGRILLSAKAVDEVIKSAINNTGVIEAGSIAMEGDTIALTPTSVLTATALGTTETPSIALKANLAVSNAGKINTGITGTVEVKALGEITNESTGEITAGTITLDGTTIKLEADVTDPLVPIKSKLIATTGPVTLKALGAITNDGLIESAAAATSDVPSIGITGESVTLGATSQLLAKDAADAAIKVTAAKGDVSNAGQIITDADGESGKVELTSTKGSVKGEAKSLVKSGTITINAGKDIELKGTAADARSELVASQGNVTLNITDATSSGLISNAGLIETPASFSDASPILFNGAKVITLGQFSELKAQNTAAVIQLTASEGDLSIGGKIVTGNEGATGSVELNATKGSVKADASSSVRSGTITLDAGKGIDLKGTDALVKSQLKASVGSVTLKATEAIKNDGLIETAANVGKTIEFTGAKSIELGANSELRAKAEGATIDLKASAGIISNAGSIITGEDGDSGTVNMTALAGDITNSATGIVKSRKVTLSAFNLDIKAVPPAPLYTSFAITNDGKIETSAVGESISIIGKSINLGTTSELKSKAAESRIKLIADSGDIKNAGSIITDADGQTGSVMMTAGVGSKPPIGSIKNAATGVVKSGAISLDAQHITLEATDADHKSQLIASQGPVSMLASGDATIDGLVQSKAADGGVITLNAANILLKSNALLDASGTKAGAVTTTAGFKLDAADGAQVKTLSSEEPSKLGTWTASAADVHVRTVVVTVADDPNDNTKKITTFGRSGVDLGASKAGALVTRVNLLDTDQTVMAKDMVGDLSKVQKAAKANGTDQTTELVTKQGWNIVVDEAINKPEAAKTTVGSAKDTPVPQDVTLTLKSGRDININEAITSDYGRGRLNLVLTAEGDVSIGEKGQIATNGGNFYVGEVTAAPSITAMDTVSAKGRDFVMKAGAAINVDAKSYGGYGGYGDGNNGVVIVNVSQDIKLQEGSTITKSNTSGYNNAIKKSIYNSNAWGYFYNYRPFGSSNYSLDLNSGRDIVVGGNVSASNTTVNVNAGRDILSEAGGRIQSAGYSTTVNINAERNIGSSSQSLRIDADLQPTYPMDPDYPFFPFFYYPSTPETNQTLNVFNNTGSSYIRNDTAYYNNITLTTTTKTDGVQSIVMADGRQVVATAAKAVDGGTPSILTIDTGGVKADDVSNLTIKSPNMILKPGAISSLSGETPLSPTGPNADPSYKVPTGTSLTLTAQTEDGDYGFIRASEPAKLASPADVNREIMVPNGTVTLNALNIGTESAMSDAAKEFKQALEIDSTTLNVNNYGGSTWIANSSYNTLTFKLLDAAGNAAGSHHILSTNGDFFNVESTSASEMVVYSIDRVGLTASTDPLSTTPRMSGIYTRSTDGAHKNVTLDTGSGGSSRDLIFMDDAVDLGAATLSLTAQSGKSIQGYSSTLLQKDATVFGDALLTGTGHKTLYKDGAADKPHLTVGNLNMTATNSGSTMGGGGYDLKVAKGGADDQINATTNRLTINNQSGAIALHELSAKHFKDITITDSNSNLKHTVVIDLFHNQDVKEQVNYTDTTRGAVVFDKTSVALSGYNRNLTLNLDSKKVEIGGFGTADGKVTSGDFTVNAATLKLGGDITTTHRANENNGFDRGNVKFRASSYTLTDNVKIDTNTTASDLTADDNKVSSGNITLESRYYAAPISGNGFSLTVNAASSDPVTVAGGNIKADVVAAGTSGNALKNLSFTSNTVDGQGGKVDILGNQFLITGDFKASGTVKMNGATSTTWGGESDFTIATNLAGSGDSGAITFDGTSLTLNKGYGTATFDASSKTGKAGNITLWDSAAGDKHSSSLRVGNIVVDATGKDASSNGSISVDNVETTGRATTYFTTSGYTDASQTYTADKVTLGGKLLTKSGDVNVEAKKEVVVANDVKIQTFNGNPDESSNKFQTGEAGAVTLGKAGAKLTASGQTLEVDASAGRGWMYFDDKAVLLDSYTPKHGLITFNDSTASAGTEFKNLTVIGTNVVGDITKYTTTDQMTLGLLDQATAGWSKVKAGSLLLLGQNKTDYTFDKADIGKLGADDTGKLKVTATSDFTVAPLSYAGTFGASPNGIDISADVQVSGASLTVDTNTQVKTSGKVDLSSTSTASEKGILLKDGSQVTSYGGSTLTTAGGDIDIGKGVDVRDYASVILKAKGAIKIADELDETYSWNLGSVTSTTGTTSLTAGSDINLGKRSKVNAATDVTLVADGAITMGDGAQVNSLSKYNSDTKLSTGGDASLTAGKNIELGASSSVSSTLGKTTLSANGDIKLGDYSNVQGATGVTITATKNTDTDPVKNGDVVLGTGATVQSSTSGTTANDVTITADGAIKVGVNSTLSSNYGSVALTAGSDIELGIPPADAPMLFSVPVTSLIVDNAAVTLSAEGDIRVGDNSIVQGSGAVTMTSTTGDIEVGMNTSVIGGGSYGSPVTADVNLTATAGQIKVGDMSQMISYGGGVNLTSGGSVDKGGISLGQKSYAYGKNNVSMTTQVGKIQIADNSMIDSLTGNITMNVSGEGAIDIGSGTVLQTSGAAAASKLSTGTGDITFAGNANNLNSSNTGEWLVISAGSSKKKEDATGGDVIFTGSISSSSGRAVIYSGSADKAEESPDSYISRYTLGSYVYGFDSSDNKPDFSQMPGGSLAVAFRQKAGNLTLSIPSEKVYNGKTWVNEVTDVKTQEQLALDVGGLRKWESAYVDDKRGPASAYDYLAGPEIKWIPSGYSLKSDSGELKNVGDYKVKFKKDPTAPEVTNPVGYGVSAPGGVDASVDFKITPKELTVNLQASKTYDGNDVAALNVNSFQVSGFAMSESATVSKTTGTFNSKNVAQANSVTTTLTAGDFIPAVDTGFLASNYSYKIVDGEGKIFAKEISAAALNPANTLKKVYDGTSTANLSGLMDFIFTGLVAGESMSVGNGLGQYGAYRDGTFVASKNVRDVNLVQVLMSNPTYAMGAGTLASNYLLPTVLVSEATGQITPRQLLATAKAEDKLFDGKADAKAVISFVKPSEGTGVVGNDQVSLAFRTAEFVDNQVGVNKKVFLREPFAQGADSDNYVVSFDGEFPAKDVTTQASIRPLNLTPVVMAPPAPVAGVIAPPNFSNGPVQSIGGMGVVNVASSSQSTGPAGDAGGMTPVTIESLLSNQAAVPNQVYVVDGGIKFETADK